MNGENELFDKVVKAEGYAGRLPDDAPERKNPIFARTKEKVDAMIHVFRNGIVTQKPVPTIIVDYINSPLLEAWAKRQDDYYVIAFTHGMLLNMEFMFNRLLSDRRFMPDYGDISLEAELLPAISVSPDYEETAAQLRSYNLTVQDFVPKDQDRRDVANFLIETSIHFMMGHEFRHIQAGHCDYYQHHFKLSSISEKVATSSTVEIPMKQQAMEWDADCFSLYAILRDRHSICKLATKLPENFERFYSEPDRLFALIVISCLGFFKLLDFEEPLPAKWLNRSHPASRNRRMTMVTNATMMLLSIDSTIYNKKIIDSGLDQIASNFEVLAIDMFSLAENRGFVDLNSSEANAHHFKVLRVWNEIVPDLLKYSFVPINKAPI